MPRIRTARNLTGERLRRYRNVRYRRLLNEPGFEVCNLLLQTGDHLLLQTGTPANPDVLSLQAQT